ncbi:MAG: hypothetical protein NTZ46_10665 [Verrucomicrobia bacterium]|nr:hypothetical protein [Verrucomicrobiota bacterium]
MKQPYVVPSTARRDLCLGLAGGLVLMALAVFGFMKMSGGVTGIILNGQIVAKHFTPFAEKQVSFGKGGVRQIEGDYVLECDVKGRLYLVTVDKETYKAAQVGKQYLFPRPRE